MKTRCGKCGRATDEKEEPKPVSIRNSMKTLGITADVLLARIREDLERGLIKEARAHLNFVDRVVANAQVEQTLKAREGENE